MRASASFAPSNSFSILATSSGDKFSDITAGPGGNHSGSAMLLPVEPPSSATWRSTRSTILFHASLLRILFIVLPLLPTHIIYHFFYTVSTPVFCLLFSFCLQRSSVKLNCVTDCRSVQISTNPYISVQNTPFLLTFGVGSIEKSACLRYITLR